MATLQPAFAEATACQAEVLTTDRPTPSAFVPQSTAAQGRLFEAASIVIPSSFSI